MANLEKIVEDLSALTILEAADLAKMLAAEVAVKRECESDGHVWKDLIVPHWKSGYDNAAYGSKCARCGEKKFPEFEGWLLKQYGSRITHTVSDFLINAGVTGRQQLEEAYSEQKDRFLRW